MSWPKVRFGEVCEEVRERISSNDVDLEDYITTDNMLKNRGGCVCASSLLPNTSLVKYKMGDVLISNIRPYLKKIGIMAHDGGCSNDVIVYRVKDPDLLPEYLYTALSQDRFFDYVMENVSGTKMPRGRRDWIRKFEFPLPLPEEQRRIVRDVDLAMKRVDAIERQFEKLRETAAACFKAELKATFDSLAWDEQLSDQCEVITDGDHLPPPKTSSGIPFLVISDVAGGRLDFENTRFVPREYFDKIQASRKPMSANAGVPLAVVQSIVGHATADMTRHYYHESQGALVAAVAALPDVVKPGTGTPTTDTVTPRVKALCAALDALDAQEREMVLRHLQNAGRVVSVAPAPCAPESTPPIVQYPLVPVAAA